MAPPPPNVDTFVGSYSRNNANKPPRLSMESLQRSFSDLSLELSREAANAKLPAITEVVDVRCECCGMCEECTPDYIQRIRDRYYGKWLCGLCGEAVHEEIETKGERKEKALSEHMSFCVSFNRNGRAYPVLYQAEAMKEILKKSSKLEGRGVRAKSNSPRDRSGPKKVGIMRTSSCIPMITREMNNGTVEKDGKMKGQMEATTREMDVRPVVGTMVERNGQMEALMGERNENMVAGKTTERNESRAVGMTREMNDQRKGIEKEVNNGSTLD